LFSIEFFAFDPEQKLLPHTFPISTQMSLGMRYCPWCGTALDDFYSSELDQLLADQAARDAAT
jgi:hypothetical protein